MRNSTKRIIKKEVKDLDGNVPALLEYISEATEQLAMYKYMLQDAVCGRLTDKLKSKTAMQLCGLVEMYGYKINLAAKELQRTSARIGRHISKDYIEWILRQTKVK